MVAHYNRRRISIIIESNDFEKKTYSEIWVTSRLAGAGVLRDCTAMLYEPVADPVQPDGGGSEGAIDSVTACLARILAIGLAEAVAARARRVKAYCIIIGLSISINYRI